MNNKAVQLIHAGTEKYGVSPPFTEREGQLLKAFYCVTVEALRLSDKCKKAETELKAIKPGGVNE